MPLEPSSRPSNPPPDAAELAVLPLTTDAERVGWIIALASSAGGLDALSRVLQALPSELPAAVVVVQHMDPSRRSHLAEILARRTTLRVKEAVAHEQLTAGTVFVAPPNLHLLVRPNGHLSLSHSAPVHFVRPSADLLFESAAESFGEHAVAVVLSGTGRDGAEGTRVIKRFGGTVIVQDEASSAFFGMPDAAIRAGRVDMILDLDAIPVAIMALVGSRAAS
jgi:two-component system, chemotaxis family, protein-glutamate methylesterase/glutaminase